MEWTREKTLLLINEYRKRRGLWDMTHDDYRKKEMKQKLLIEVSASLGGGIPIVEIEKKFHTLRTQYHREINRMKRKEPYNSKWFGFKNLQFLSSPKACRSNRGRIKSEITEEGTVTTKYIIREAPSTHDSSGGSPNSSSNLNEEFLTIHRKPTTITYETLGGASNTVQVSTSRAHELEKLIEETTKDVEDIEEPKPKVSIKEITVPLDPHTYSQLNTSGSEVTVTAGGQDPLQPHETHQQQMEEEEHIETIDLQTADDEMAYQSSGSGGVQQTAHHSQAMPTRIIKIQRRNTCQEEDYYGDDNQLQEHHLHHIHAVTSTPKRVYYETNGHHTASTIMAAAQPSSHSTLLNPTAKMHKMQSQHQHTRNSVAQTQLASQPQTSAHQVRDDFSTYGEYVANEMRGITNRQILIALKHKINTALFEASMAELQK